MRLFFISREIKNMFSTNVQLLENKLSRCSSITKITFYVGTTKLTKNEGLNILEPFTRKWISRSKQCLLIRYGNYNNLKMVCNTNKRNDDTLS